MPVNRKRHAVDGAPPGRWKLLGSQFRKRRVQLGYRYRPAFAAARLPLTAQGNRMIRAVNAIENGERPGSYTEETMAMYARAYEVTEESVYALLRGEMDVLTPVVSVNAAPATALAAAAQPHAGPGDGEPLFADPGETAADRPFAEDIHSRLRQLERRGIAAETAAGAQVFRRLGEEHDAVFWDKCAADMWDLEHRIWMAARVRRQRAAQQLENLPDAG